MNAAREVTKPFYYYRHIIAGDIARGTFIQAFHHSFLRPFMRHTHYIPSFNLSAVKYYTKFLFM